MKREKKIHNPIIAKCCETHYKYTRNCIVIHTIMSTSSNHIISWFVLNNQTICKLSREMRCKVLVMTNHELLFFFLSYFFVLTSALLNIRHTVTVQISLLSHHSIMRGPHIRGFTSYTAC